MLYICRILFTASIKRRHAIGGLTGFLPQFVGGAGGVRFIYSTLLVSGHVTGNALFRFARK